MSSKSTTYRAPLAVYNGFCLVAFVAIKIGGAALASWSWWWLLLPAVPVTARLLDAAGLL